MTFYLGAPNPQWLGYSRRPLMVSHNQLRRIKSISALPIREIAPRSCRPIDWIPDSGAYFFITRHGRYPDTPEQYVRAIRRYDVEIGGLRWAAPQDVPCEAEALRATGATVAEHIERTVHSYLDCTHLWYDLTHHRESPFRPVLQGHHPEDYLRCWDLYDKLGVDLTRADVVGVGSVCTRERTDEIVGIVEAIRERRPRALHGFGVHAEALDLFDDADSQAWSAIARWEKIKHPCCSQLHLVCSSCLTWAEAWHDRVIERLATRPSRLRRGRQLPLFAP